MECLGDTTAIGNVLRFADNTSAFNHKLHLARCRWWEAVFPPAGSPSGDSTYYGKYVVTRKGEGGLSFSNALEEAKRRADSYISQHLQCHSASSGDMVLISEGGRSLNICFERCVAEGTFHHAATLVNFTYRPLPLTDGSAAPMHDIGVFYKPQWVHIFFFANMRGEKSWSGGPHGVDSVVFHERIEKPIDTLTTDLTVSWPDIVQKAERNHPDFLYLSYSVLVRQEVSVLFSGNATPETAEDICAYSKSFTGSTKTFALYERNGRGKGDWACQVDDDEFRITQPSLSPFEYLERARRHV